MKQCKGCNEFKLLNLFAKCKTTKDKVQVYCKSCVVKKGQTIYKASHDDNHWKRKGYLNKDGTLFTTSNKMDLYILQCGRCAICLKPEINIGKAFAVDTNHLTKVVRGLLCDNCNLNIVAANTLETAKALLHYLAASQS